MSASKVHSYTSTELGLSTSVSEGVREKTCSGIASVNHGASYVILVSSVFSVSLVIYIYFFAVVKAKVKCALLLVRELPKQSAL